MSHIMVMIFNIYDPTNDILFHVHGNIQKFQLLKRNVFPMCQNKFGYMY